jgi:preprotein translocase subunit SecF
VVDLFRTRHWDLIKWRNLWFALSLAIIIPGFIALVTRGLNLGIDFTGGGLITYVLPQPARASQLIGADDLAERIKKTTGVEVRVQLAGVSGRVDQILVRTRVQQVEHDERVIAQQEGRITQVMKEQFPGIRRGSLETVSPVVSEDLIWNAIWSVLIGCGFILLWIRIRYFDFKWAFSAVVALAHDVLVLLGVFALMQKEVNSPFVAAALTVVGFSVHDSIIIFDRIRENVKLRKGSNFHETANISLLETLARSVNTVLTVEFVLLAIYFFGGTTLRDFTFAMIVGVTVGAYSSIFNASQLLVVLKEREERKLAARRAVQSARAPQARPRPSQAAAPRMQSRPAAPATPPTQALEAAGETNGATETTSPARVQTARKKLKASGKRKRRF